MPSCQNCKKTFEISDKDTEFYENIDVPEPTWCPECRAIRRLTFRNHKKLVKRKCGVPGHEEMIMSIWPESSGLTVYDNDFWHSDAFDVWSYGRDYDFNRSFFEQFRELMLSVPTLAQDRVGIENSEYSDGGWIKNCYLVFNTGYCEDCAYGITLTNCSNCFDLDTAAQCELCYNSSDLVKCYRTFYSLRMEECRDAWFSRDCIGCTNIFGCTNLRNKSYCVYNKPVSKDEFEQFMKAQNTGSTVFVNETIAKSNKLWLSGPVRYANIAHSTNCSGDHISHCLDVRNSYGMKDAENVSDSQLVYFGPTKDSKDLSFVGINAARAYECADGGVGLNNVRFCYFVLGSHDIDYSINCWDSNDLFACVGLRKASYAIFNKRYSKEDYFALKAKIVEQMKSVPYVDKNGRSFKYGEFFPIEFSPQVFKHSWARELYKLSDKQIADWRYKFESDKTDAKHEPTLRSENIPDNISDIEDNITSEIIECAKSPLCNDCPGAFKLTPKELAFYREMRLPIPRLCFNCRNAELLKWRNPFRLHERNCDKTGCPSKFQTTYESSNPQVVYCDTCYKELIQ